MTPLIRSIVARNVMMATAAFILSLLAIKTMLVEDQVSIALSDVHETVANIGPHALAASLNLERASREFADGAREQRSYAKALTKSSALAAGETVRAMQDIRTTITQFGADEQVLAKGAAQILLDTDTVLDTTNALVMNVDASQQGLTQRAATEMRDGGRALRETLSQASAALEGVRNVEAKLFPPLIKTSDSLAQSADNVSHATESIRLALEPLRKPTGRLKFVLKWLLGLPRLNVF